MIVNLTKEEVRACADVALNRWMMKWDSVDRPNYAGANKAKLEPEVTANIRTIVTEYAVSKLYKTPLVFPFYDNSEHAWRSKFPDVMPNFEVKSIRTKDAIPLFKKDNKPGYLLVGTFVMNTNTFAEVDVFGWMPIEDGYKDEFWSANEGFWRIPKDKFNDTIPELKA